MDEKERKIQIDDGASEGIDRFVDLWEAQLSLWNPE